MKETRYFVLLVIIAVFLIILNVPNMIKFERINLGTLEDKNKGIIPPSKPFIYLTETEQCLPSHLASSTQIGDPDTCNCDVIVLSFRSECHRDEKPSHVSYLFDPNTTWASGRNVLFFEAMDRRPGYHYYIFLNDDTVLSFNRFTPAELTKLSPFRVVENWLLDYEPAVGVLDYKRHNGAAALLDRRKTLCGINETSLVLPTVFFDAVFNAFHFKAIAYIFPYSTQYEYESWWVANKRIVSAVEVKFPGQALLFAPVTANNPKHRNYPRHVKGQSQKWREIIEEIRQEAPPKLRNHALFKQFQTYPDIYTSQLSRTFCLNVTRHQSIIPYRNFGSQFEPFVEVPSSQKALSLSAGTPSP